MTVKPCNKLAVGVHRLE